MRIDNATIFCLRIPFVEAFRHSSSTRNYSDSIVVRLTADDGTVGYGEGVARPYVTGETVESVVSHIANRLWPAVADANLSAIFERHDPLAGLSSISEALPDQASNSCSDDDADGVIAWHGARTAVELALIDCLLRSAGLSIGKLLPPRRDSVTYSGVITAGPVDAAVRHARYLKLFGLKNLKIKIGTVNPVERVAAIRRAVGPETSLSVDANGAYDLPTAARILSALHEFGVAVAEQPIGRCHPNELARLREISPIPIMADESLVTLADARALIDGHACDYFNLRISKCGGIIRTLQMAALANSAGVRLQLGSHVGETAILSAAGRGLAAHLDRVEFVEGSYGKLLLADDISQDSVVFGHGGVAPSLRSPGLGIKVREEVLRQYAQNIISLTSPPQLAHFRKGQTTNVSTNQEGDPLARTMRGSQVGSSGNIPRDCSKTFPA